MEIILTLREDKAGRLVYGIPIWYRLVMFGITALLAASLLVSQSSSDAPGSSVVSWIIVGIALLAALYEETWVLDKSAATLSHRFGILILAKTITLPLARIQSFRLRAFYKGSNPGAPGAAGESTRILTALNADTDLSDLKERQKMRRKAYITLLCDDSEGGGLVVNTQPMRRAGALKLAAARLAEAAGVALHND